MSFRPVIIDVGIFKQLPSGEALDAGGWTLPTTGGTENYALIADVSGNAVWAQPDHGDLAGLGDDDHPQYVLNVGETSNVDLGSQTLTTTGTVVGSNIPAPTASNQLLQAVAANVAAWSTDVTGLTSLTVDNIAIDGATILSTTGAISFGDEDLSTTGDITSNNLHLNGYTDNVDYVEFNTAYADGIIEGRLQWNLEDGTLEVGMPGGNVNLQIGQETLVRVRNVSGSTIPNGTAVRVTGSQANRPTITPADASSSATATAVGITTEEISNNSNGYMTIIGLLHDLNTDAFNEGDLLWLSYTTPGEYITTMPDAPYSRVAMGYVVRKHASEGIIAANPLFVPRYENASGVKLETNSDDDFLRWDAANSWWSRQGDSSIDHGSIGGLTDDDHPQYLMRTGWEIDYAQTNKTTLTVNDSTRTLSIAPTGVDFEFWVSGIKYTKTTSQDVIFGDTEGVWYIYFNNSGVLTASQTLWDINANDWAGVCVIYWDTDSNAHLWLGPEFHSHRMNPATHHYLHFTCGCRWESGLGVAINGDNIDVGAGKVHDEDIEINITDSIAGGMWQQDLTPASLPIFYRSGTTAWRKVSASTTPLYLDTNIPQLNTESGGSWSWTAVGVNEYFAYWVVASHDHEEPVILIPGQESSGTLTSARDGNKLADMNFGNLPMEESKVIARLIVQRKVASPYYDLIEIDDYRQAVDEPSGGGSFVGDHGNLTGLGDDDHPHYLKYIGATANVDLGTYDLTTTGTVVGSNVPAPTVASKVLTSTGVGTATWQDPTGGGVTDHGALTGLSDDDHPQYVTYTGASGTVNLGAEALTTTSTVVGSNLPAPTITGKVLTSTGANTATWQDPTAEADTLDTVADRGATTDQILTTGGLTTTGTVSAGLLTVDNITINGAVISSDTGAISFSDEDLSTSGTVVGSNIPSPTVDDQVLISTASGVAAWSTAGNNQVLGSGGTGEVAWESKSFGYNIPANSVANEVYVGTGVGTAAWTTDLTGLTSLTVDNITINGAVISSDTGAISFSDENVSTTGSMTANTLTDGTASLTSGSLTGVKLGSLTSNGFVKTSASDGTLSVDTATYLTAEADTLDTVADRGATTDQILTTGGLTTTGTVSAGLLTVDNITINGAVISSDTGAISFSDEDLVTTGFISTSQGTKYTHGNTVIPYNKPYSHYQGGTGTYGTCVIDLPEAHNNTFITIKIRGYHYASSGPWEILFGGYSYNATPDRWTSHRASVNGEPPFNSIRAGYNGNTGKACIMLGETTTNWRYALIEISDVLVTKTDFETGWNIAFYADETNFYNHASSDPADPVTVTWNRDFQAPSADNQLLVATGDKIASWTDTLDILKVDDITIDGAVISSDTGAIGFSNENLSTTGTVIGSNIPSPTVDDQVLISTASGVAAWSTAGNDQYLSSDGAGEVAWAAKPQAMADPTADNQLLVATGASAASWTDTLDILKVDNITIDGAVISSDTGAIGFSNENLSTTGTMVGSNIPSPTADDQALSSSAAGIASWNITCLADVLAQEVPSASGGQRKFVLTADSSSKFEIESAPWTLMLSANETIYVRTTGNDTTGDGTSGAPFLTLERTIEFIGGLYIGDYTVTVDIGEGVFTEAGTLSFQHPFGAQVTWQGVSEQITSQDTASISATGTTLGYSNLYKYDVTMVLPVGKSVSIGDYIAIREISGGTLPEALYGCHYVSNWVSGTRTATIQIVYRNGAPKASGTVTCTIELIKTVIAFNNKNGLKLTGTYTGGLWKGLVIQGNYNTTNTSAKYGIWCLNTAGISIGGSNTTGWAIGIVGFQTGLYAQNNAMIFGDYSFVSKCGTRCANGQNGGILNLRYSRLSGANNNGIFAFNGSTVAASQVKIVAVGDDSVFSYQGAFIDVTSSYVDQNNATNAFSADRWSGLDATSASYSDAINPATGGNNDGSYVIT